MQRYPGLQIIFYKTDLFGIDHTISSFNDDENYDLKKINPFNMLKMQHTEIAISAKINGTSYFYNLKRKLSC